MKLLRKTPKCALKLYFEAMKVSLVRVFLIGTFFLNIEHHFHNKFSPTANSHTSKKKTVNCKADALREERFETPTRQEPIKLDRSSRQSQPNHLNIQLHSQYHATMHAANRISCRSYVGSVYLYAAPCF